MKTVQWVMIGCRVLAVSFSLTLVGSGCGDSGAKPASSVTDEEAKRDAETRKAMEAASQAAKKR